MERRSVMNYDEIADLCEQLGYRDKLRLAQLLIQLDRKEEENQNPQERVENSRQASPISKNSSETIQYVIERLKKLKPGESFSPELNRCNVSVSRWYF